jgi:hypothetical protein
MKSLQRTIWYILYIIFKSGFATCGGHAAKSGFAAFGGHATKGGFAAFGDYTIKIINR